MVVELFKMTLMDRFVQMKRRRCERHVKWQDHKFHWAGKTIKSNNCQVCNGSLFFNDCCWLNNILRKKINIRRHWICFIRQRLPDILFFSSILVTRHKITWKEKSMSVIISHLFPDTWLWYVSWLAICRRYISFQEHNRSCNM